MLKSEFYNYGDLPRSTRSVNSGNETYGRLEHGELSGYYEQKGTYKGQQNSSGSYSNSTESLEYSDYSNNGGLYFGGGYGMATFGFYNYNNSTGSTEKEDRKLNGKIKFNGDFIGTLEFKNFEYTYEYKGSVGNTYKHNNGSVMIGTLNVTNEYVKYILKNESVPNVHIHSWQNGTDLATCFQEGREYRYCLSCGKEENTRTIPKLTGSACEDACNHNWEDIYSAPNCDERGFEYKRCSHCYEIADIKYISQLNCDGKIDPAVVGTWLYEVQYSYGYYQEYLVFNANGTGMSYYYEYDVYDGEYYDWSDIVSWYTEDGVLHIKESGDWYYDGYSYSVSSNKLTISGYYVYNKYTGQLPSFTSKSGRSVDSEKSPRLKEMLKKRK